MSYAAWFSRNQRYSVLVLLSALISACGGGDEQSSVTPDTASVVLGPKTTNTATGTTSGPSTVLGVTTTSPSPLTISGTVIDGPVINATVTIRDATNQLITTVYSNASANYSAHIPAQTRFPLTITASNGVNIITQNTPTFTLESTVLSPDQTTANLSPFTTLIVKTARKMPGGLNAENLEGANHSILTSFNAGLDRSQIPTPVSTPISSQNVATLVKSSEVLAEIIRRNFSVISDVYSSATQDSIIENLAADMTDGLLDGAGANGVDPLVSSVISVGSGQVLIEALRNSLQVNNVSVTAALDDAIAAIMPGASDATGDLAITTEMLSNTRAAVTAALLITPTIALSDIQTTLNSADRYTRWQQYSAMLDANAGDELNGAINTLVDSSDSQADVLTETPVVDTIVQTPFAGTPKILPGRIEAEDYDVGGPGVAYSDTTIGNSWNLYRHDDVDILQSNDIGGGYMVGVTNATEWLEYTVDVATAGTYTINLRVATALDGKQVRLLTDGNDITGPMVIPNTGDWANWVTISKTATLKAGPQILRLQIDSGSVNINYLEIVADGSSDPQVPFSNTPWPIPGKVEAEDFDLGGAGIAYSDTTAGNNRGYYRNEDVDIFVSDDVDGGFFVGLTETGEWMEYTVNVASAGTYTVNLRIATAGDNRQVRMLMNGSDVSGAISIPNTGGWNLWQTVSKTVNLNAGKQVLRLQIEGGSVNINTINISAGNTAPSQPSVIENARLTVTWNPNPETVGGYIVYFGPSENAVTNESTDITAFAGSFDPANPAIEYDSWYDLGLQLGDNVCFKIRAYNADGFSDWSLPACTTVPTTI